MVCRWRHRIAALVVALALAAASGVARDARAEPVLSDDVVAMLETLEVMRGGGLERTALRDRPVIVTFFASWCVPCRTEFIELRKLIRALGPEALEVVAINWLEDVGHYPAESTRLMRMLDRVDPNIAVLEGTREVSEAFGGIGSLPVLFVFDGTGRAVFSFIYEEGTARTFLTADELRTILTHAG